MTTVYLAPNSLDREKNTFHLTASSIIEDDEFFSIVSEMMTEEDYYGEFNFY